MKPAKSRAGRTWISGIAGLMMALSLTACNGSDASSATTTSTLQLAPPTTDEQATTTATPSTTTTTSTTEAAPSTTVAVTTAPPTTTVEDQLNAAIERAQTAIKNCYAALPGPCDQAEIEEALVGKQLATLRRDAQDAAEVGYHAEHLDRLVWTTLEGPTLKGSDLAVATICRHDGSVAVNADGSILNDDVTDFRQTWHLLPVGSTWKLSEVLDLGAVSASEGDSCE